MTDRLLDLRTFWDQLASNDPLWAVLSDPAKRGRRWTLQDFMASGEREIALLFQRCAQLGLRPATGRVMDFGCGVGRLSQALARRFDRVVGVDISPEMVELAGRLNQYPESVHYVCSFNRTLRDSVTRPFDLIYSNIVLQHVPPDMAVGYIAECLGLLAPGALYVFQLPSHRQDPSDVVTTPMSDPAYQAHVSLVQEPDGPLAATEVVHWRVRVTNTTPHDWRQPDIGSLRVGNHWFDASGRFMLIQDDGRTVLPQVVRAGESCEVTLALTAPAEPHPYWVEIDIVHEGVSWFKDKGSTPLRLPIRVTERREPLAVPAAVATMMEYAVPEYPQAALDRAAAPPALEGDTTFPMFGVPQAEVLDLLHRHQATVHQIDEDPRAGTEWVSYRYFVTAGAGSIESAAGRPTNLA